MKSSRPTNPLTAQKEMKTKPTSKQKTQKKSKRQSPPSNQSQRPKQTGVTVDKTIYLYIKGRQIEVTEKEARDLLAALQKEFGGSGINIDLPSVDKMRKLADRLHPIPTIPPWPQPPAQPFHWPNDRDQFYRVTCHGSASHPAEATRSESNPFNK